MNSPDIIKRALLTEKTRIVEFLNEHWGDFHPLVNNDIFFDFYYLDGEFINFYYLEIDGKIVSICGYIRTSHKNDSDIWVSIWCAKKGKNGLGLSLMGKMQELTGAKVISCNNIRENTMPFYTFLGYYPDKLQHYYRLRNLESYNIATVTSKIIPESKIIDYITLKPVLSIEEIEKSFEIPQSIAPQKDFWYINKRYFNAPYYKYNVFSIYQGSACVALVVFRINEGCEGKVLRLVDYIGLPQNFKLLSGQIDLLLKEFDCEYCDMYAFGVDGKTAGFSLREINDTNIIPNYLNPVLCKNTDYFFFTSNLEGFMMFKADGDQDRKNLL